MLVRLLRLAPSPPKHLLLDALGLLRSLLELQDSHAEERLLRTIEIHHSPLEGVYASARAHPRSSTPRGRGGQTAGDVIGGMGQDWYIGIGNTFEVHMFIKPTSGDM